MDLFGRLPRIASHDELPHLRSASVDAECHWHSAPCKHSKFADLLCKSLLPHIYHLTLASSYSGFNITSFQDLYTGSDRQQRICQNAQNKDPDSPGQHINVFIRIHADQHQ